MMLGRRKSEQVRGRERSVASTDGAPQIPAMPLSLARSGATVTVARVKGSGEVKRHLETLGFVEGSEVHVVATGGGNIIVVVKGGALWPGRKGRHERTGCLRAHASHVRVR